MDTLVFDPYATAQPDFFGMSWEELCEVKHPTAWVDFELGKLDERQYLESYFADGRPYDHEGLKRCMWESYRWLDGMEELLAELAEAGVEMHALSNYPEWFRMIEEKLGLSRYLRWSFVSCRTGRRKPAEETYLEAAASLGTAPEVCLFVDDRQGNCQAAEEAGMPAVQFQGAEALRRELGRRGFLNGQGSS